jgi:hypothetical protein
MPAQKTSAASLGASPARTSGAVNGSASAAGSAPSSVRGNAGMTGSPSTMRTSLGPSLPLITPRECR